MKKRLYFFIALVIAACVVFFGAMVYVTYRNNLNTAKSTVTEKVQILASLYDGADPYNFVQAGENTRITVISQDGHVLADNFTRPYIADYLSRPEIIAAAADAPAVSVRYSRTLGANFIYYAQKVNLPDGYVFIRAAVLVENTTFYIRQSLPFLITLLLALMLICILLAVGTAKQILRPINEVDKKLRHMLHGSHKYETTPASYEKMVDEIAHALQNNFNLLNDEKNKLEYILNSIGDGIFVADSDSAIALVNHAATELFGAAQNLTGKKLQYLLSDSTLINAVNDCITHTNSALFEHTINGKIYLVTIKNLPNTDLTMTILADITQNRENAKRREEFFANASHELKTPLTAIRGFTELAVHNNQDGNLDKFLNGITRETTRLMALIADMLKLSELENTREIPSPSEISLAKTANEAIDALAVAIDEKSVFINITGDTTVNAEPNHIFETLKNLIENAVRYNNKNGKVNIKIEPARITVSDTGIGISPAEQTKIFERFYRVEKSRASINGGTGLGLAIVKHVCALYGWKLSLKSKPGIGTDVVIDL